MRKRSCAVSYYTLFQLECAGIKLIILSFLRDQLIMAAALNDAALLQNRDAVGIADGGQTVGDDEDGAPLHELVHALLDERFRPVEFLSSGGRNFVASGFLEPFLFSKNL